MWSPETLNFNDIKDVVQAAECLQTAGKNEKALEIMQELANEILKSEK